MFEKLKKLLDTKNKKIIALISAVVVITITSISVYAITNNSKKELLKLLDEVVLEYGEDVSKDAELYIDTSELTDEERDDVLKNATVEFADIEIEEDVTYPQIGEYTVAVTFKDEQLETKLTVQDTTPPEFNDVNEVSFEQGTEDFPYNEHIFAEDLQEITYDYQTDTVDVNTAGEYLMIVVATDASGNSTEKEIQVIVTEKVEEEPQEENADINDASANGSPNNNTPNSNAGGNNNTSNHPNSNTNSNGSPNTGGNANSNNQGGNSGGSTPPPSTPNPPAENPYAIENLVISAPGADGRSNNFWFANGARNDAWVENYIDSQPFPWVYRGFGFASNGYGGVVYWLYV